MLVNSEKEGIKIDIMDLIRLLQGDDEEVKKEYNGDLGQKI